MQKPPLGLVKLLIKSGLAQHIPEFKKNSDDVTLLKFMSDSTLMGPHAHLRHMGTLLDEAAAETSGDNAPIDLTLGAPDFGDSWFLESLPKAEAKSSFCSLNYPPSQGFVELRQSIADKLKRENGVEYVALKEILITNGANQAISLAMDAFVSPGDGVVLFDPGYMMYNFVAQLKRAHIRWVSTQQHDGYVAFDEAVLAKAMRGAKIVFVNSPTNPSGCCLTREGIERIAYYAKKYDVLVFSDEVYEHFNEDGVPISFASLPGLRERTLTVNSLSKSYGLAALRIGYIAAQAALLRPIKMQMVVRCPFVNTWSQMVAQRMLLHPPAKVTALRASVNARRVQAYQDFHQAGLPVVRPRGAFYLWMPTSGYGLSGREFAADLYATKRVMVMPGESFGPSGENYVRLSVSGSSESHANALRRMVEFTAQLKKRE